MNFMQRIVHKMSPFTALCKSQIPLSLCGSTLVDDQLRTCLRPTSNQLA